MRTHAHDRVGRAKIQRSTTEGVANGLTGWSMIDCARACNILSFALAQAEMKSCLVELSVCDLALRELVDTFDVKELILVGYSRGCYRLASLPPPPHRTSFFS